MHERFIVVCSDRFAGYWGSGSTLEEAIEKALDSLGENQLPANAKAYRFSSPLPFAPCDREATENECDAYVSANGTICWIRCEKEDFPLSHLGKYLLD